MNTTAMRTVTVIFPNTFDVGCFSHTLDIVGEKFNTPHLTEFLLLGFVCSYTAQGSTCLAATDRKSRKITEQNQMVELLGNL